MTDPTSKAEVMEQLRLVQRSILDDIHAMSVAQFNTGAAEAWSAAGYLKHLILSIKPVAKALGFPPERLQSLFGLAETPSRPYTQVVVAYQARLAEGIRAEDYEKVTPGFYRIPEGVTDEKVYLTETWEESNNRLLAAVEGWDEDKLDTHQMPHPAIGMVTIREMLFFTLFHNRLHAQDMRNAAARF